MEPAEIILSIWTLSIYSILGTGLCLWYLHYNYNSAETPQYVERIVAKGCISYTWTYTNFQKRVSASVFWVIGVLPIIIFILEKCVLNLSTNFYGFIFLIGILSLIGMKLTFDTTNSYLGNPKNVYEFNT